MKWLLRDEYIGCPHTLDLISNWYVALHPSNDDRAVIGVYQKDEKWWAFTGTVKDYEVVPEAKTLEEAQAYAEISYRMRSST